MDNQNQRVTEQADREWVQRTWMECNQDIFAFTRAVRQAAPEAPTAWMVGRELFLSHDAIPARLLPPLGDPVPLYTKPATQQAGAAVVTPQAAAAAGIECGDTACAGCMSGGPECIHAPAATTASASLDEIFAAIDEAQRMNRYNESSFQLGVRVARLKCLADDLRASLAQQGAAQGGE